VTRSTTTAGAPTMRLFHDDTLRAATALQTQRRHKGFSVIWLFELSA
jgi:hypothetical protein